MCESCTCTVDLRLCVSYRFRSSSLTHQVYYHVWHFLHYWFDVVIFTVMVCFTSWLPVMLCFVLYSVHMLSCPPFVSLEWCLCSLCMFCIFSCCSLLSVEDEFLSSWDLRYYCVKNKKSFPFCWISSYCEESLANKDVQLCWSSLSFASVGACEPVEV